MKIPFFLLSPPGLIILLFLCSITIVPAVIFRKKKEMGPIRIIMLLLILLLLLCSVLIKSTKPYQLDPFVLWGGGGGINLDDNHYIFYSFYLAAFLFISLPFSFTSEKFKNKKTSFLFLILPFLAFIFTAFFIFRNCANDLNEDAYMNALQELGGLG